MAASASADCQRAQSGSGATTSSRTHPLFRRLVPEIRKAFQFEATRTNGTWSEIGWGILVT